MTRLFELLSENKNELRVIATKDGLGISRNAELNTFLLTFDYAITPIEDMPSLFDKQLNPKTLYHAIHCSFKRSITSINDFEKGIPCWMEKLNLTDQEYGQILSQRKGSDNQITS